MSNTVFWLFLASCLSLFGLWISFFLASKAQRQKEKRSRRLQSIGQAKTLPTPVHLSAFTPSARKKNLSPVAIAGSIIGIDPARLSQYSVPWWLLLIVTLGIAKGIQSLAENFAGNLSYVAIPLVWIMLSRYAFGSLEKRRKRKAVMQLPDMLDQIVRGVRVGVPVLEAIRAATADAVEPTKTEFSRLIDLVSVGTPLEDAVADMARRCDLSEYSFFATALSLQNQTGGALSETLTNLSEVIRKRIAIIEKGKALSSEAKATAVVLTLLPIVTGLIMWMINPAYMELLVTEPLGKKMLGGAAVSLLMGLLTIRVMFQKALSLT